MDILDYKTLEDIRIPAKLAFTRHLDEGRLELKVADIRYTEAEGDHESFNIFQQSAE